MLTLSNEKKTEIKSVGSFYKNIFTERAGQTLEGITFQSGKKNLDFSDSINRHDFILTERKDIFMKKNRNKKNKIILKTINQKDKTPIKMKTANKLYNLSLSDLSVNSLNISNSFIMKIDAAIENADNSMKLRINKFLKTGDLNYLSYCPRCAHCIKRNPELFAIKMHLKHLSENKESIIKESIEKMNCPEFSNVS